MSRPFHERGFVGVEAGDLWAVLPKEVSAVSAAEAAKDAPPSPLPDAVAHALDRLNAAQEAYNRAWQDIAEVRYQTFSDWHKFMVAYYSDQDWLQHFRENADSMRDFTERVDLDPLTAKLSVAGVLLGRENSWQCQGAVVANLDIATGVSTPDAFANSTLAAQVLLRLKSLAGTLNLAGLSSSFKIVPQSVARFWRPREPVVLVSGEEAVSTPRHGEDGQLPCTGLTLPDIPGSPAFLSTVDELKPMVGDPALQTQGEPPWHPILLEWSLDVSPVTSQRVRNEAAATHSTISRSF